MLSFHIREGVAWAVALSPSFISGRQLVGGLEALERSTGQPIGTGLLVDARAIGTEARWHTASELASTAVELGRLGIRRCAIVPAPGRRTQAERVAEAANSQSLPMAVFVEPDEAVRWLTKGH